jgi:hypothetical protein
MIQWSQLSRDQLTAESAWQLVDREKKGNIIKQNVVVARSFPAFQSFSIVDGPKQHRAH